MIKAVSEKIIHILLDKEAIVSEEREVYLFGLEQILSSILNVISILIVGLLMNEVFSCVIFTISFAAIRHHAGGYHASTRLRCYMLTIVTVIIVLSVIRYASMGVEILASLLMISSVTILLLSPVDTENKRLDSIEQAYYRRKAIIVWGLECMTAVACMAFGYMPLAECIVLALVVLGIAQVAEREKMAFGKQVG